nr:hypothetical protein [uncultured Carboxylicivirga sp.]
MSAKPFSYQEHCSVNDYSLTYLTEEQSEKLDGPFYEQYFKKFHFGRVANQSCYTIEREELEDSSRYKLTTGYFVGVDWIEESKSAIYVAPKLNTESKETDYIKMLFSCLSNPEVSKDINELFEVKWDRPGIEIEQKQDLLTPFLVVEYLSILKTIVRKGLKKSYYRVERNLNCRIKGKVMVSSTIKKNLLQNKPLKTYCSYEEFGVNNHENRLLHMALVFVKRYLPGYHKILDHKTLQDTFNYINPSFSAVSEEVNLNEIKQIKTSALYKEYEPALRLAKLILKRFGYNISNTTNNLIQTPPFWIDMSKLFELYVLGLLKKRFHNEVQYHFTTDGNELDYILKSDDYKMVIDAKYIPAWKDNINHENIRQVSGYSRLEKVYNHLYEDADFDKIPDGLIIYPDEDGVENFDYIDLKQNKIAQYYGFFKIGVKLPGIE